MLPKDDGVPWPRFDCSVAADVPAPTLKIVRSEIVAQLGCPVDAMFPAFAAAFPLCVAAMKQYWATPKLVTVRVVTNWIASIVLEGPVAKNIRIMLRSVDAEVDGPEFEEYKAMLPMAWKELYRWFDSFGMQESPFGSNWINTPFHHPARLDLEQYRQRIGGKKADIRVFEKVIDSNKFRCWLLTEAGDTLWLDEQRCDHKVYHLHGGNFKDVGVIENPALALDSYLAHFVAGGKPSDFDFYQWRSPMHPNPKQGFFAKPFDKK